MKLMNYYLYWKINYGMEYVMSNFIKIYKSYTVLKDISDKYGIVDKFDNFLKRKVVINRYFTAPYIGNIVKDWEDRRGRNYRVLVEQIFKYGEKHGNK